MATFASAPDVVATTGAVIADGATGPGLELTAAQETLGRDVYEGGWPGLAPEWACYGCNMAVRLSVVREQAVRFDERLPLYGWWEDIDFTLRLAKYGRVVKVNGARGVIFGGQAGAYLWSALWLLTGGQSPLYGAKRECSLGRGGTHGWAPYRVNFLRSASPEAYVDRRGRLKGNLLAWWDVLRGVFKVDAKRRARLKTFRHRCNCGAATVLTMPGVALNARHHWLDRRQVNFIVNRRQFEVGFKKRGPTMGAAHRLSDNRLIGVSLQRAPSAFTAKTAFAWPFALGLLVKVGLLALRRRQARIVERFGWSAQLAFQLSNALPQLLNLRPKRTYQFVFLRVRQVVKVG